MAHTDIQYQASQVHASLDAQWRSPDGDTVGGSVSCVDQGGNLWLVPAVDPLHSGTHYIVVLTEGATLVGTLSVTYNTSGSDSGGGGSSSTMYPVTYFSGNTTCTSGSGVYVQNDGSSSATLTLPLSSENEGASIIVRRGQGSAGSLWVGTEPADKYLGSTTYSHTMGGNGSVVSFFSSGTSWYRASSS